MIQNVMYLPIHIRRIQLRAMLLIIILKKFKKTFLMVLIDEVECDE